MWHQRDIGELKFCNRSQAVFFASIDAETFQRPGTATVVDCVGCG